MLNDIIREDIQDVCNRLEKAGTDFAGKKVLITGGAGFLGSWMCDVLIELGANVTCVDNLSSGLFSNIAHLKKCKNFEFIKHDISKPLHIAWRYDFVIHAASRASPLEFSKFPLEIIKANTLGTMNSLEIAKRCAARFLFTSTSEVYGDPQVVPTPENYSGNVNPIGPRGCYDESKRAGEALVLAYLRQYDADVRIARIFNTYGPRMRAGDVYGRVVSRFISQALEGSPLTVFGKGTQTRSFTYVTDEVEGLLKLLVHKRGKGEVINIGSDHEMRIIDLAKLILKLAGSSSKITFKPLPKDDPKRRCPNITKARKILKWKPTIPLTVGLEKTISYFRLAQKMQ